MVDDLFFLCHFCPAKRRGGGESLRLAAHGVSQGRAQRMLPQEQERKRGCRCNFEQKGAGRTAGFLWVQPLSGMREKKGTDSGKGLAWNGRVAVMAFQGSSLSVDTTGVGGQARIGRKQPALLFFIERKGVRTPVCPPLRWDRPGLCVSLTSQRDPQVRHGVV